MGQGLFEVEALEDMDVDDIDFTVNSAATLLLAIVAKDDTVAEKVTVPVLPHELVNNQEAPGSPVDERVRRRCHQDCRTASGTERRTGQQSEDANSTLPLRWRVHHEINVIGVHAFKRLHLKETSIHYHPFQIVFWKLHWPTTTVSTNSSVHRPVVGRDSVANASFFT